MKNQLKLLAVILVFVSSAISAQVRIGGGVSIDISVPPLPEVIIVNPGPETPRTDRRNRRVERPVDNRTNRRGDRNSRFNSRFGEIRNQNGPNGVQDFPVANAQIQPLRDGLENVVYQLASGDVLELVIATSNPNDYNYHFNNQRWQANNNRIVKVLLNNRYLDLRNGSLSLQPAGQRGFHSVINLHSVYEGDFNGTVNF